MAGSAVQRRTTPHLVRELDLGDGRDGVSGPIGAAHCGRAVGRTPRLERLALLRDDAVQLGLRQPCAAKPVGLSSAR
jgi:hypothetical protein